MMIYSIPALTMENEFADLAWLGAYVDRLVKISSEYATVHRWNGDSMEGPPDDVLLRVGSTWEIVARA
jgi:hypothetical protein